MRTDRPKMPDWYRNLVPYQKKNRTKAAMQIINSFIPYFVLWGLMVFATQSGLPYWITLLLTVAASCFLIRIFIVFHDCVHSSFYKKQWANTVAGYVAGTLTFTPFHAWRTSHLTHHATNGQLDHRGDGDVWTMTTEEYREASVGKRFIYRFFRAPPVMFLLGPAFMFFIVQRFSGFNGPKKARTSIVLTNLFIAGIVLGLGFTIGFGTYFLIQIPVMLIAGAMGIWLFYVQHQFSPGYWKHDAEWNSLDAAILGSSHYDLPRFLHWISGNIGFHSLHHLKPGIPNYNLQRCFEENDELRQSNSLSLWQSLKTLKHKLWSEELGGYVTFREAKQLQSS